ATRNPYRARTRRCRSARALPPTRVAARTTDAGPHRARCARGCGACGTDPRSRARSLRTARRAALRSGPLRAPRAESCAYPPCVTLLDARELSVELLAGLVDARPDRVDWYALDLRDVLAAVTVDLEQHERGALGLVQLEQELLEQLLA